MFLKKNWLPITVFIIAMGGIAVYYLQTRPPKEPIKIYKPVEVEKPKTEVPVGDTSQGGHWHGDEWHADPHETHDTPAVSAGQSYIPEGAAVSPNFPPVDANADPVEEAYKRLEYIKNNPYAWGGVHSERATELLAQLIPPPYLVDHDHGDEVTALIDELCEQNDPRAAEALIGIMCQGDGSIMGRVMFDTLEAIGPPAVPYILPYLFREETYGSDWIYVDLPITDSLSRIGVKYRADLGGILDHIIIPKLEEIAADDNNERYSKSSVMDAREALDRLGR